MLNNSISFVLVLGFSDLQLQPFVYLIAVDPYFMDSHNPEVHHKVLLNLGLLALISRFTQIGCIFWYFGWERHQTHILLSFCPIVFHCTAVSHVWSTLECKSFNFNRSCNEDLFCYFTTTRIIQLKVIMW